ncbi:MAG: helix-turn-helix domain-containing protein, partial [Thermoleophilaceae bacterium]
MSDVNTEGAPLATPSRRQRAAATRRRIGQAAFGLFALNGYAATTMEAIARDAGVAVQTLYFTFHTKAAVLIEAMKVGGGAPAEAVEVMNRPWIEEAFDAHTGGRRLAVIVEHGTDIYTRLAPMYSAVSAAASIDSDVDEAWQRIVRGRREGMRRITQAMEQRGELHDGIGFDRAADIMSAVHRAETYLALVGESGWSVEAYKAWVYVTLARQLLTDDQAASALAPGSDALVDISFAAARAELPIG